VGPMSLIYGM